MSQATRILAGLATGLALGAFAARSAANLDAALAIASVVGGIWLDALRMTIVPLVFSLVVTGMSSAAAKAGSGGVTRRALLLFAALLLASAVVGALLGPLFLSAWSPPGLDSLRAELPAGGMPDVPPFAQWLRGLVPTNPVAAAAEGAIVPLTLFALIFGVAAGTLDEARSRPLLGFFAAVVDAMLVVVRWILLLAPIGIFALAFGVAARTGLGLGAALAWYVIVQVGVTLVLALAMYPLAVFAGGTLLRSFAKAVAPAQAVALSTQSSLASLPVMLAGAERLGLTPARSAVVLPLAVALFRIAAPASIVVVTLALAAMTGTELGAGQLGLVVAMATLNTLVIAGLPNQITFFAAYAPPAMAVGVPVELLPLLLAIDTIPDMFYTLSNVTADLAATAVVDRSSETVLSDPAAPAGERSG